MAMAMHDGDRDRVEQRFADANMSSSTCVGSDDFYDVDKQFSNIEKGGTSSSSSNSSGSVHIKLDSKGLPLVPQPSRFKDDPLVSFYEAPAQS